jgi:Flp pilus assembly protein TadD
VLPLPGQLTIGCERCHGPGRLHVQQREAGEPPGGLDDTIVNPAHLEPSLREAVCQQCHLMGEERVARRGRNLFDYRPGLPLHLFFSTFVRSPEMVEGQKSVSHVEQMYESRCFRQSTGQSKLGCISCHDPHQLPAPEKQVAFYRERCLACHEILASGGVATHERRGATEVSAQDSLNHSPKQDSAPLTIGHSATDNCTACHMPRRTTSNIAHEAITDHRIVRHPGRAGKNDNTNHPRSQPGQIPLVYFDRELHDPNDPEVLRDLAIASVNIARREVPEELRQAMCQRATTHLNRAVRADPDDIDALEAKGFGLWVRAQPQRAVEAFETVLTMVPQREVSRKAAGDLAAELGHDETASEHLRQLLAINPWSGAAHYSLSKLLAKHEDWPGAIHEASAVLRLDPTHVAARSLLVAGYLQTGDRKRARQEFDIVERLQPAHLEQLRAWFKKETR